MEDMFSNCDSCLQIFKNNDLYRICWFTLCEVCIEDIKTSLVEYYKTRGVKEEE